jgi:hypothetical protein
LRALLLHLPVGFSASLRVAAKHGGNEARGGLKKQRQRPSVNAAYQIQYE